MKALLWVLVIFVQIHEYKSCLEEERIGLLHLKSFLKSIPYTNSNYLLPSWVDNSKSIECCGWERVRCNSTTSHIIELSLENLKQDPYYGEHNYEKVSFGDRWLLNVSMLKPFKELRSLDISFNAIGGCIPYEGFERLVVLRNLETLNLNYNHFDDNIIPSLSELTSLTTLSLAFNRLGERVTIEDWKLLSRLENLEILDLSYNYLNHNALQSLAVVKSLKNLNLAGNQLTGTSFPTRGMFIFLLSLYFIEFTITKVILIRI
ncbi:hypothetical protein I3842_01G103800 [Carya illinoinensis]|uniref:Leucine-rich repeat-containing N-terminal plant-type domain-containing protein n=1 Tax=Carya illinoinensis TaxID=32201 RepID=A0A922K3R2_CARIL|nr:hypothetical protein I3842_01G103800 [Carya illinoinensis]